MRFAIFRLLAVGLILTAGPAPAPAAEPDDDLLASLCRDSKACTRAVGAYDAAAATAAGLDAWKKRAAAYWDSVGKTPTTTDEDIRARPLAERKAMAERCVRNNANLPEVCQGFYLTESEIAAGKPRATRPEPDYTPAGAQRIRDRLYDEDMRIKADLESTCDTVAKAAADYRQCGAMLQRLNALEAEAARWNADPKYRAAHRQQITLWSTETATRLGFPKTPRGVWDTDYSSGDLRPTQADGTQSPAPTDTPTLLTRSGATGRDILQQGVDQAMEREASRPEREAKAAAEEAERQRRYAILAAREREENARRQQQEAEAQRQREEQRQANGVDWAAVAAGVAGVAQAYLAAQNDSYGAPEPAYSPPPSRTYSPPPQTVARNAVQPPAANAYQPPAAAKIPGQRATCVQLRLDPRDKAGGHEFYNGCTRPVEVFWCDVASECRSGSGGSTWTIRAGRSYPAPRSDIRWAACMGANSGGWRRGAVGQAFDCEAVTDR